MQPAGRVLETPALELVGRTYHVFLCVSNKSQAKKEKYFCHKLFVEETKQLNEM